MLGKQQTSGQLTRRQLGNLKEPLCKSEGIISLIHSARLFTDSQGGFGYHFLSKVILLHNLSYEKILSTFYVNMAFIKSVEKNNKCREGYRGTRI